MRLALFLLAPAIAAAEPADPPPALADLAMVGAVGEHTASIWCATAISDPLPTLQWKPAAIPSVASILVSSTTSEIPLGPRYQLAKMRLVRFDCSGLTPATPHQVGLNLVAGLAELSFTTAPPAGSAAPLRLVFASCFRQPTGGALTALGRERADLALFIGDNGYFLPARRVPGGDDMLLPADWDSPGQMAEVHLGFKNISALRPLFRSASCLAIWDDHDYGPNDSDGTFALKGDSRRLFQASWANQPAAGQGIWFTIRRGDVQLFMLDDRWDRSPNRSPDGPGKSLLGPAQKAWLKSELLASTATLKLIVCGGQFLADYSERFESWQLFRNEREELLAFFQEHKVPGLVFLSGDRHLAELIRWDRAGLPPLYELTSSAASAGMVSATFRDLVNPRRVAGCTDQQNYGVVEWDPTRGSVALAVHGSDGAAVFRQVVEISPPRR
ncbi:hypothetical protein LBMAG53_33850 [Planctomycetota bacterium]|nr:hypothetical protein LBMAG53_33850 [Planctomycetota bacterium]